MRVPAWILLAVLWAAFVSPCRHGAELQHVATSACATAPSSACPGSPCAEAADLPAACTDDLKIDVSKSQPAPIRLPALNLPARFALPTRSAHWPQRESSALGQGSAGLSLLDSVRLLI